MAIGKILYKRCCNGDSKSIYCVLCELYEKDKEGITGMVRFI